MTEVYWHPELKENEYLLEGKDFVCLDIGAGQKVSKVDPNFITVDAHTEADINAPMWYIPLPDGSVDAIWCDQALEHVSKFMVVPTLREWRRLLKLGGTIALKVPNFEWACLWWVSHQTVGWDMDIIYGSQDHEGQFHRTGFTEQILRDYIEVTGGLTIKNVDFTGGIWSRDELYGKKPPEGQIWVVQQIIEMEIVKDA